MNNAISLVIFCSDSSECDSNICNISAAHIRHHGTVLGCVQLQELLKVLQKWSYIDLSLCISIIDIMVRSEDLKWGNGNEWILFYVATSWTALFSKLGCCLQIARLLFGWSTFIDWMPFLTSTNVSGSILVSILQESTRHYNWQKTFFDYLAHMYTCIKESDNRLTEEWKSKSN